MIYLTNLNLNKNELQNAVMHPLAVAPLNPREGQLYYNSVDKLLYQYNGSSWTPVGELNIIETVKVNGTALTPSNKEVDISVPLQSTATPQMDGTAAVGTSTKYAREDHVHPIDTSRMAANLKGAANGVAELDSSGKVPSSQLPSYVDDVQEYTSQSEFPATGETGKIYVDTSTNLTYRWSGSTYVEISPSLALGETSSTAYRGDRGKTAYDHSQITSGNPHNVSKSDVGLSNVDNTSDATKKTNFTGSIASGNTGFVTGGDTYTELEKKLPKSGGTMTGAIAMGSNKITGLGAPTSDADAATKKYVDDATTGFIKTATGTIATTGTSAEVSYTGTLINAYATIGGAKVELDITLASNKVTFFTAAAPGAAVTCTVVYA